MVACSFLELKSTNRISNRYSHKLGLGIIQGEGATSRIYGIATTVAKIAGKFCQVLVFAHPLPDTPLPMC